MSRARDAANFSSDGLLSAVIDVTGNSDRVGIGSTTPTATLDVGGDINVVKGVVVAGVSTFSSNVSIAGTLTYEDVTNVDSVGIITARSDVSIADKIVHTGDTNTAIRFPSNDTFAVETGGTERLRIDSSGNIKYTYSDSSTSTSSQIPPGIRIYNTDNTLGRLAGINFSHGGGGSANAGIFHVLSRK